VQRGVAVTTFYLLVAALAGVTPAVHAQDAAANYKGPDFDITAASVRHDVDLNLLIFEQEVAGTAGHTVPVAAGQIDGAPVLGYVFPTSLPAEAVGFGSATGIVALAATTHPDFDDTPLWDENGDGDYGNDGVRWHTHWVLLVEDARVPGRFSVKEFQQADAVVLPPTNPGMPMYMDSPGFSVVTRGQAIRVIVPADRIRTGEGEPAFSFDAVTCYMRVSVPSGEAAGTQKMPMLGVYEVFDVLSGDLSLPYSVTRDDR